MKFCKACNHENPDTATFCQECNTPLDYSANIGETTIADKKQTVFGKGDLIDNRYQVIEELGRGGMGVVYKVNDTRLNDRIVALKMIHQELVTNPEARKRFEAEVAICLDLEHPSIIRVQNLESSSNLHYFTMMFLDGKSLGSYMAERKDKLPPCTVTEIKAVMTPLLDGLAYAHQYTIHRDIKPDNIMVLGAFPDVTVKILDFGIARTMSTSRFTQTAQGLGTPYYMAPEQLDDAHAIDQRADLYSVGMVLYEMLIGKRAIGRFRLPSELLAEYPISLDYLIEQVLSPEVEERIADCATMQEALTVSWEEMEQNWERKRLAELKKREKERKQAEIQKLAIVLSMTVDKLRKEEEAEHKRKAEIKEKRRAEEAARKRQAAERKKAAQKTERKQALAEQQRLQKEKKAEAKKKAKPQRQTEEQRKRDLATKKAKNEQQKQSEVARNKSKKPMVALVAGVALLAGGGIYFLIGGEEGYIPPTPFNEQVAPLGETYTEQTTGMEFVWVPGGCFQMGDTFGDGSADEKPVHKVCVDGFYMGKYEVTQGEYQKIAGKNSSRFKKDDLITTKAQQ